jgi:exoribonuclease R
MEKEIIEFLEKNTGPVSLVKLARNLNLNKTERTKLKGLLGYLDKKGLLKLKGDKVQALPRNKISRGIISLNKRGFAFVTPETAEGSSADILSHPVRTSGALTVIS